MTDMDKNVANLGIHGMVIAGALSDYVKPADAERFAALFPQVAIDFIEGAGHWVHAEKPEASVAALQRALGHTG